MGCCQRGSDWIGQARDRLTPPGAVMRARRLAPGVPALRRGQVRRCWRPATGSTPPRRRRSCPPERLMIVVFRWGVTSLQAIEAATVAGLSPAAFSPSQILAGAASPFGGRSTRPIALLWGFMTYGERRAPTNRASPLSSPPALRASSRDKKAALRGPSLTLRPFRLRRAAPAIAVSPSAGRLALCGANHGDDDGSGPWIRDENPNRRI